MSGLIMEEFDLMADKKYRRYMDEIDRGLKNFENTNDWSDLISHLTKLNKVREMTCLNK